MNHDGWDSPVSWDFSGLKPGKVRTVRAESGTSLAALAVCDSSYNGFVWTGVRTATTDWQQLTVTVTATGQGVARVHLTKHDTTGALLWDDVELAGGEYAISGVKMRYYPYGQEVGTATANDAAKFGTYTRDASSGLDYAMNRYYQSTWGRFTSPDQGPAVPTSPLTWNRYSYAWSDPINLNDPDGMLPAAPPGCVAYPFGAPGGSIDASSNCPPGYIEVDTWNTGSWTSLSPLRQVHDAVTLLENFVGATVSPLGRGYGIAIDGALFDFMQQTGTISVGADGAYRIGGILVRIVVVVQSGAPVIPPLLTNPVTVVVTVVGVVALGTVAYWMAKNAAANKGFDQAIRDYESLCGKRLDKDQRQRVHRAISGQHLDPDDIIGVAISIFGCPSDPGRIGK